MKKTNMYDFSLTTEAATTGVEEAQDKIVVEVDTIKVVEIDKEMIETIMIIIIMEEMISIEIVDDKIIIIMVCIREKTRTH